MAVDITIMIGGEAGQGVQSMGAILAKTLARNGYYVFADQDYESRVRGGHNFFRIRVSDHAVSAIRERVDILIALNEETVSLHRNELTENGMVVSDTLPADLAETLPRSVSIPYEDLARENTGSTRSFNIVPLGAVSYLAGFSLESLQRVTREHFGEEVGAANDRAAAAGYRYLEENGKIQPLFALSTLDRPEKLLMNGNEAIALGAIAAGCTLMSAYPMTPASSIMEFFAAHSEDMGLVMLQAEDEIAAVLVAIGASYAGTRAMTATSGSGLCLMVEGIGLAGLTETPLVVIDAQRPGPATGLPTRTEQGDLSFVLSLSHGEFPRAVLAPSSIRDCFYLAFKAFNLAEKYQTPVFLLTDHHLASSYITLDAFVLDEMRIDRGSLYNVESGVQNRYQRHKITASGISPRAFPGQQGVLVSTDADEHNETGHLTEDAGMRKAQVQKRLRKQFSIHQNIAEPIRYGPHTALVTLVGWGSTAGALYEATDILNRQGSSVNLIILQELWPFPSDIMENALRAAKYSYVVEGNATGQLARLIKAETGLPVSGSILKYDGRPMTPDWVIRRVKEEVCECDEHG